MEEVFIGRNSIITAYSYIIEGGNYKLDSKEIPINQQPDFEGKGGVEIEGNTWIGAHCMVLDGVKIGQGSVVAVGAVVNKSIPQYSVAAGIPAKVIRER